MSKETTEIMSDWYSDLNNDTSQHNILCVTQNPKAKHTVLVTCTLIQHELSLNGGVSFIILKTNF